ncbi:acyltransferase domain-containing protein, partial [Streptomyces sp. SHP 1-2]|uniref:acyltransferase domain-containing protein n=1 Tax=Streptomyces sp. SHP 1-2 TaxID=2769489 RepID=UPI002238397C
HHVETIQEHLAKALAGITPQRAEVPFYSTVTGTLLDTTRLDTDYWYTNLRHTVRFTDATHTAQADGHHTFIEISPHPVLTPAIEETLDTAEDTGHPAVTVTGTLRRGEGGLRRLLTSLAEAHVHGATVTWPGLAPTGPTLDLPTYPFQRQRYWLTPTTTANPHTAGLDSTTHPLLSAALTLPDDELVLTGRLSTTTHPWLTDHAV